MDKVISYSKNMRLSEFIEFLGSRVSSQILFISMPF